MKLLRAYALLVAVLSGLCARIVFAQHATAADLFHQGLTLERADGNEAGAIFIFERVVADFPTDRDIAPQALYHLAEIYAKKSDPRALVLLARLTADFPATEYAARARTKIAEIDTQAGAPFKETDVNGYLSGVVTDPFVVRPTPAFSPDGRLVAYVKGRPTTGPFFVRDLRTGRERVVVATTGRIGAFDWSPDSTRIAVEVRFGPESNGQPPTRRELHVVVVSNADDHVVHGAENPPANAPSSGPYDISLFYRCAWSPDSRFLVYDATMPSEVRLFTIATNQSRSLGAAGDPGLAPAAWTPDFRWSPDSRRFLFHVTTRNAPEVLKVVTAATAEVREMPAVGASASARISLGDWKDNDTIPYWTQPKPAPRQGGPPSPSVQLTGSMLSLNTGELTPLCVQAGRDGDRCDSILRDGKRELVWRKASTNYAVRELATGLETPLTVASGEERNAILTDDGRLIAFQSNRDGRWAEYVVPIDAIPVRDPIRIMYLEDTPTNLLAASTRWSPDGRLIQAYMRRERNVFRINMDPASGHAVALPERLTQDSSFNEDPLISPDGKRIAYLIRKGPAGSSVAVMDANGANERPLVQVGAGNAWAWLSPTDLLVSKADPGSNGLRRPAFLDLNLDTGVTVPYGAAPSLPETALFDGYGQQTRDWFYEESEHRASEADDMTVLKVQMRDGAVRTLVRTHDLEGFAVARDGKSVVVSTEPAHGKPYELHLVTTDGVEIKLLLRMDSKDDSVIPYPHAWSPNNRFLLYEVENGDENVLHVLDVNTGAHWPLLEVHGSEPTNFEDGDWSPDGTFIVAKQTSTTRFWHVFDGVNYETVKRLTSARK